MPELDRDQAPDASGAVAAPELAPGPSTPVSAVLALQRSAGNAFVSRMLRSVARQEVKDPPAADPGSSIRSDAERALYADKPDYEEAARILIKGSDADKKAVLSRLPNDKLEALKEANERVNGAEAHRVRGPILDVQWFNALVARDWDNVARHLGGFDDHGIEEHLASMESLYLNPTRLASKRVNGGNSWRIERPILKRQFDEAHTASDWRAVAFVINDSEPEEARKRVGQLNKPELEKVRDVAVAEASLTTTRRLVIAELSHAGLDNDPRDRTIDMEVDPDDPNAPGQINLRLVQEHTSARYIDNKVASVVVGIYLPGILLLTELEHPIIVPWDQVDFSARNATPTGDRVFDSRDAALVAVKAAVPVPGGTFAYYWGAGGQVTAPTMLSRASAPRIVAMAEEALARLKSEVQTELTVMAIGLAAGALLGFASTKLPMRDASKLRQAAKDAMPVPKAAGGAGAEGAEGAEGSLGAADTGGLSRLRPRAPGDLEPPLPGETPEHYYDRTRGDSPPLSDLPEPARRANIKSAERAMAKARVQLQLRDPDATWTHYTTSGGYESIMRGQQLRAGGGQQGLGQGEGVRAVAGPFNDGAPAVSGNVYFDFQVPNPPVPGYATSFNWMGDGAMWPMPAGDMLPIRITRVGYPNGASAFRTGGGTWRLTAPTGETAELSLEELVNLGQRPQVPKGAK